MIRYEHSIPLRAALGIAAMGMSGLTLSLLLIMPLELASASRNEAILAATTARTLSATQDAAQAITLKGVPSEASGVTIHCTTSDSTQPQSARHT